MADKILVSAQAMEATINRYNEAYDTMEKARNDMDKALDHLNNCWRGKSWAAMKATWAVINGNIERSAMAIERSMQGLKDVIATYDQGESEVVSQVNTLDEGTKSNTYV